MTDLHVQMSTEMQGNPINITLKQKAPNKFSRVMIAGGMALWTDYYDTASGLKVQSVSVLKSPRGEMQQTTQYADYKDFKELKYPSVITQGNGQFQMQIAVDKVKINDGLKDSEFVVK